MQLNSAQQTAVQHVWGPMMVIAGPGSGKTAVLTRRIQWMVDMAHIQPDVILVITFTKAAADEMKTRFLKLIDKKHTEVTFGTFHSVFYSILRKKLGIHLHLVETEEAQEWITEYISAQMNCDHTEARWRAFFILSEYSRLLNTGTYDKQRMDDMMGHGVFEDAVLYYREMKRMKGCIDYDDMLIQLRELLLTDQKVLNECREHYQYILVDEFQDINSVQYDILCQLAEPHRNLFVVGDDDQAIYGFRGSQPEYLLQFPNRFPETKRVDLTINYRCRKEIVTAAGNLIGVNQKRYDKHCESGVNGKGYVRFWKNHNEDREVNRICDLLRQYKEEVPYQEMAVLYRTHAQSQKLMENMLVWGIPFQCKETKADLLQSQILQNIHTFIEYAKSGNASDLRKIWEIIAESIPDYFAKDNLLLEDPRLTAGEIARLEEVRIQFSKLKKKSLTASIIYIWNRMGYKQYARKRCEEEGTPWSIVENHLRWILRMAAKNKDHDEYLWKNIVQSDDGVQLLSMHGSKGLEFAAVVIMDANEGICPYESAVTEAAVEEERRIFYVAMTRAKKYLDIFYTVKGRRRQKRSRFISEIKY